MKKILLLSLASAAACLLTGCETTGLSSREHSGVDYPNYVLSLANARSNAPAQKPVLPVHLAVAQIGESAPPRGMLDALTARPDLIASAIGLPLPGQTENSEYYAKNRPTPDYAGQVKAICQLAQASGADYVFLFGGSVDSWTEGNALRFFDCTILGGMLLPATKINLAGKGAGVLIDAATAQPVRLVNADFKQSKYCPDFFSSERTTAMQVRARDELVQKLQKNLASTLENKPQP